MTKVLLIAALLCAAAGSVVPVGVRAQDPDTARARAEADRIRAESERARGADADRLRRQAEAQGMSQAELIDRLRLSGMTRAQVRSRLQQLGYDPGLADQYFDAIERGGEPPRGRAPDTFLQALQRIGILARPDSLGADSLALRVDSIAADSLMTDSARLAEPQVFGRSLFSRAAGSQFQPLTTGPVDASYRLGPGDEIILILTGDVELAYNLPVAREGYIVIPDVGQIFVNGVTLGQLEDRLYDRLGRVYSGVSRRADASTRFQLSLGRLRTNQVFLVGEVVRPGAYQVSSAATVFNALYSAGGPNAQGSFRRIEVRRAGQVTREVDIYDYLLRGDNRDDIRLENGDIVFVPVSGRRVRIEGSIKRPAIYELDDDDGMRELLMYAGGLEAAAYARRIQIDRILPPDRRQPGVERVLLDVDVQSVARTASVVPLQDGDVVQVFAVEEERRNRVVLAGQVRRPGVYEWAQGTTLRDVLERAQGLEESAYTPRVHIYRLNEIDGSRRLLSASLEVDTERRAISDVTLADRDSIVVYSMQRLTNARYVAIDGFVKKPDTYLLAEGMTLQDLILAAGGFIPGASTLEAEVARLPTHSSRSDTTARVLHVPLSNGGMISPANGQAAGTVPTDVPAWLPAAGEVTLEHGDRVFVRKAPGYELPRSVKITGNVMVPGTYVLELRQERLSDVLARAGSLTSQAYAPGFQLFRRGILMATNLQRALREPGGRFNIELEPGDSLHVPVYDPTVLVTGAVAFESRVLYVPGQDADYYIRQAGGFAERAAKDRLTVSFQDGSRAVSRNFLGARRSPTPRPGSTVFVPAKPESEVAGFNWEAFLTRSLTIMSSTATLLIALRQLQ